MANLTDKYYQLLRLYEQNKNGEIEANKLKAEHSRQSARTNLLETEMAALKEQVKDHEMKNAESLKLLQLLNENITKREEKLSGELIEQGQYAKKVAEQLALTARMHEEALETIDRLSKVG